MLAWERSKSPETAQKVVYLYRQLATNTVVRPIIEVDNAVFAFVRGGTIPVGLGQTGLVHCGPVVREPVRDPNDTPHLPLVDDPWLGPQP